MVSVSSFKPLWFTRIETKKNPENRLSKKGISSCNHWFSGANVTMMGHGLHGDQLDLMILKSLERINGCFFDGCFGIRSKTTLNEATWGYRIDQLRVPKTRFTDLRPSNFVSTKFPTFVGHIWSPPHREYRTVHDGPESVADIGRFRSGPLEFFRHLRFFNQITFRLHHELGTTFEWRILIEAYMMLNAYSLKQSSECVPWYSRNP